MTEQVVPAKSLHTVPAITTNQLLLTSVWTKDVQVLRAALDRIAGDGRSQVDCDVTFFEVASDRDLHVTVAHRPSGDAVPGSSRDTHDGIVHTRSFVRVPRYQVLREIRAMVFAGRA